MLSIKIIKNYLREKLEQLKITKKKIILGSILVTPILIYGSGLIILNSQETTINSSQIQISPSFGPLPELSGPPIGYQLPTQNRLIFLRCTDNHLNKNDKCYLQVSELFKPETETNVHTFTFTQYPEPQPETEENSIVLHGIVGNKVIYAKQDHSSPDKPEYSLGIIDLVTRKNTVIPTEVNYHDIVLNGFEYGYGLYIDAINQKLYIHDIQYDLITNNTQKVVPAAPNGFSYYVTGATSNKLFIKEIPDDGEPLSITLKTFNLNTRKWEPDPLEFRNDLLKFNNNYQKMVWVERTGEDYPRIYRLKVSNTDGGNEQELYKIENSENENWEKPWKSIDWVEISPLGSVVTAKVRTHSKNRASSKSDWFAWIIDPQLASQEAPFLPNNAPAPQPNIISPPKKSAWIQYSDPRTQSFKTGFIFHGQDVIVFADNFKQSNPGIVVIRTDFDQGESPSNINWVHFVNNLLFQLSPEKSEFWTVLYGLFQFVPD